jgi:hypothetical protein
VVLERLLGLDVGNLMLNVNSGEHRETRFPGLWFAPSVSGLDARATNPESLVSLRSSVYGAGSAR